MLSELEKIGWVAAIGIAAVILFAVAARAHDPYAGLYVPGTSESDIKNGSGRSCCGGGPDGDCFETDARRVNDRLQALVPGDRNRGFDGKSGLPAWIDVPDDRVLPAELNPYAGPSLCFIPSRGVICFLPGRGM